MPVFLKRSIPTFVIILALAAFFGACAPSPMDRPVVEEFTIEEYNKVAAQDTFMFLMYWLVEDVRNKEAVTPEQKARWEGLTYRRVERVLRQLWDEEFVQSLYQKGVEEWPALYGHFQAKADSVFAHWDRYRQERALGDDYRSDEAIPSAVRDAWGYRNEIMRRGFTGRIATEVLGCEYVSQIDFAQRAVDDYFNHMDSLAYAFINLRGYVRIERVR